MATKRLSVGVIIPDASPLLTLARIDRLDLLDHFAAPITIVDQVQYEATKPENDPSGRVAAWLQAKGNTVQIAPTVVGAGFKAMLERGETPRSRNLGEIAVEEYALSIARLQSPPFIPLVLFEDPDVLDLALARVKNVHLLNTTAMIRALAHDGKLPQAREIVHAINHARKSPLEPFEKPARTRRLRSVWKDDKK